MKLTNPALIGHKAGETVELRFTVTLERLNGGVMSGRVNGYTYAIPETAQLMEPDPRTVMASMFGEF